MAGLDSGGALGRPEITAPTLSSEIDSSLVVAIDSLDAPHALPPLSRKVKDGPIKVRFEPARIAGCPVAQLVQMPFSFRLPHSD